MLHIFNESKARQILRLRQEQKEMESRFPQLVNMDAQRRARLQRERQQLDLNRFSDYNEQLNNAQGMTQEEMRKRRMSMQEDFAVRSLARRSNPGN